MHEQGFNNNSPQFSIPCFSEIANINGDVQQEKLVTESVTAKVQSGVIPQSKICFKNGGRILKKPALYSTLEEMKNETLPEKIPDGNKTNLSFFLKRTNFDHGPGAMKVIFI